MNKFDKNRFSSLLLTAFVSVTALSLPGAETPPANNARREWVQTRTGQLIFFAVLEGLYRDGVSNDVVDVIIPPGKDGKNQFSSDHFVYACPLCHPAFEAFRLYRQREDFYGFKARISTFGKGLDNAMTSRLQSPDAEKRRKAVEELISRWVGQRLEMMRLSKAERAAITSEMEQGRKQGMGGLKNAPGGRKSCPICDGSFGACKLSAP